MVGHASCPTDPERERNRECFFLKASPECLSSSILALATAEDSSGKEKVLRVEKTVKGN